MLSALRRHLYTELAFEEHCCWLRAQRAVHVLPLGPCRMWRLFGVTEHGIRTCCWAGCAMTWEWGNLLQGGDKRCGEPQGCTQTRPVFTEQAGTLPRVQSSVQRSKLPQRLMKRRFMQWLLWRLELFLSMWCYYVAESHCSAITA